MTIGEKIKTIDTKMGQDKAQNNFDRQTTKISALLSGNVSKYEVLTHKDVLPEKDLLEKAATIKRFEYSPLGKELIKQTKIAVRQTNNEKRHYLYLEDKEKATLKNIIDRI